MQGRHRSNGRGRVGVRTVLTVLALAAADRLRAQDDPGHPFERDGGPVVLAADRIIAWEAGPEHWVRLAGRAVVHQGAEGLRAADAVVRIVADPADPRQSRIVAYFEGLEDAEPDRASTVVAFDCSEVQIRRPFVAPAIERPPGGPRRDPVIDRALHAIRPPAARPAVDRPAPGGTPAPTPTAPIPAPPGPPEPGVAEIRDDEVRPVALFQEDDATGPQDRPAPPPPDPREPPPPPSREADSPFADPSATQFRRGEGGRIELPEPTMPEIPDLPDDAPAAAPARGGAGPQPGRAAPPTRGGSGDGDVPDLPPLPDGGLDEPVEEEPYDPNRADFVPMNPGSQRFIEVYPLNPDVAVPRRLPRTEDGADTYVYTGGVQIVVEDPKLGIVDIVGRQRDHLDAGRRRPRRPGQSADDAAGGLPRRERHAPPGHPGRPRPRRPARVQGPPPLRRPDQRAIPGPRRRAGAVRHRAS